MFNTMLINVSSSIIFESFTNFLMLDLVIQSFQLSSNTYAFVDLVIHQVVPMYTYVYFGFSNTEIWYFNIFLHASS